MLLNYDFSSSCLWFSSKGVKYTHELNHFPQAANFIITHSFYIFKKFYLIFVFFFSFLLTISEGQLSWRKPAACLFWPLLWTAHLQRRPAVCCLRAPAHPLPRVLSFIPLAKVHPSLSPQAIIPRATWTHIHRLDPRHQALGWVLLNLVCHLLLTTQCEVRVIYPSFSKNETKVQKNSLLCPKSHNQEVTELGLQPKLVKQQTRAPPT